MARDAKEAIQYRAADRTGGVRWQSSPPVCNICGQEITRQNFGCSYIEDEQPKKSQDPEQFERIECTSCSVIRESGKLFLRFLARHNLR
jgi:hypothetical protein